MRTRLKLNPGQRGTKKLVTKYGERLVCVRYRYDEEKKKRYKTVELVEEVVDWEPKKQVISPLDKVAYVKVAWGEVELGIKVKNAGGVWNGQQKAWEMMYERVVDLSLEDRVIGWKDETSWLYMCFKELLSAQGQNLVVLKK